LEIKALRVELRTGKGEHDFEIPLVSGLGKKALTVATDKIVERLVYKEIKDQLAKKLSQKVGMSVTKAWKTGQAVSAAATAGMEAADLYIYEVRVFGQVVDKAAMLDWEVEYETIECEEELIGTDLYWYGWDDEDYEDYIELKLATKNVDMNSPNQFALVIDPKVFQSVIAATKDGLKAAKDLNSDQEKLGKRTLLKLATDKGWKADVAIWGDD
jgi:hypothetical protein